MDIGILKQHENNMKYTNLEWMLKQGDKPLIALATYATWTLPIFFLYLFYRKEFLLCILAPSIGICWVFAWATSLKFLKPR